MELGRAALSEPTERGKGALFIFSLIPHKWQSLCVVLAETHLVDSYLLSLDRGWVLFLKEMFILEQCWHRGEWARRKQEDDPGVIEKPDDLSKEEYKAWINIESNLEKAEKLQKKQSAKHG
ncbi:hypothetical protein AVEN_237342-1 [Araneus ventricosus]|uniref:Uncharacterized protein n=1 Tax=Araneus ventricosus TaxID=182803 RepID=A0A4Y2VCC7_ARAVE|nr:hypothetical protein AVEN_237342-1 [Araneus ventricosus]